MAAVMARWGPKQWAVSSTKVLALEGLGFSYTQVADNNSSTEEEKTTNERGTELMPLTFTTLLHSGAGVDVRKEIGSWESLITHVHYFFLGEAQLGHLFQLRKVSVSDVKIDSKGRMLLATLSFEFKEYEADTTSVKVSNSALELAASYRDKKEKKVKNAVVKNAPTSTVKAGDYVKPTGKKYATGQKIPDWVKQKSHKVSKIKGDRVLLGAPSGINSWVYLSEVTLV